MTIEFRCGQCNQLLRVPDNSAGKNARCPKCQALMQVPAATPAAASFGGASGPAPPPPLPGQSPQAFPSFAPTPPPPPPPPQEADPFAFLKKPEPKPAAASNPFGDTGAFSATSTAFAAGPSANSYASPGGGYATGYSGSMAMYGPRSGLPWEVKGQSFGSWWETMMMILTSPSMAFSRMRQNGGLGNPIMYAIWGLGIPVALAMCVAIPIMILLGIGIGNEAGAGAGVGFGIGMTVALVIGAIIYVFLAATVGALIAAAIYHLCLVIVGGARQQFETTFRVVSFVQGAITPVGVFLGFIPYLGAFIHMIWMIALLIIGLSKAHEIPTGKAALAVLLPFGLMMLLCFGFIFLSILGAAAGN